jgi:hypothetical protein
MTWRSLAEGIGRGFMTNRHRVLLAALLVLVTSVFLSSSGGATQSSDKPKTVTCSFSNPGYSGWCKQNAPLPKDGSAQQVCQGILNCLNDVQCNETFCNATQIRGGWKLESVSVDGEKQ